MKMSILLTIWIYPVTIVFRDSVGVICFGIYNKLFGRYSMQFFLRKVMLRTKNRVLDDKLLLRSCIL